MLFKLSDISNQDPDQTSGDALVVRDKHSFPASGKLEDTLQLVKPGACVHWVSDGDWSMHDLLIGLLMISGPADVYLSSYAFSDYPARIIADHVKSKVIKTLHCLIDKRIDVRSASAITIIRNIATNLKLVNTHAKVTVIEGADKIFTVAGSANYTVNKRYEAGFIVEGPTVAAFHKKWMTDAFEKTK